MRIFTLLFLIGIISITSCSSYKYTLVYFKDPRTNQCFAAMMYVDTPFKFGNIFKITSVDCKNIPSDLIINHLPD